MKKASLHPPKLTSVFGFRRRWLFMLIGLLVLLGTIGVLSSRAGVITDAILVASDVDGGFLNGLVVIDPSNGKIVGSLAADLPAATGCSLAQPKAYLDDLAVLKAQSKVYASLRTCPGGNLADNDSLVWFDAASGRFAGRLPGPGPASHLVSLTARNRVLAISSDGTRIWTLEASSGRTVARVQLTANEAITRWGIGPSDELVAISEAGKVMRLPLDSAQKSDVLQLSGVTFPRQPQAPDSTAIVAASGSGYTLGQSGSGWKLVELLSSGTAQQYDLGAQPVSLAPAPTGELIFVATGCPATTACPANPNRLYGFNTVTKQFQSAFGNSYFPLQTSPSQVRFSGDGSKLLFDGVVVGANGVGQRYVFSLDMKNAIPEAARTAIPASRWEVETISLPAQAPTEVPVTGGTSGGGVGPNTGSLDQAPVPIDEIERLLGRPLSQIDFSQISDDQIRAFGYDPAAVRRYAAQLKLQTSLQAVASPSCGGSAELQALEQRLGKKLADIDFTQVSDAQIQAFGYDPAIVRPQILKYQQANRAGLCSDNVFTQEGFVASQSNAATPGAVAGTVANLTAQTQFDLLKGGWLIQLRWQAPGGAKQFIVYGRDNAKQTKEKKLATTDGLVRKVNFGGFNSLALPAIWHDQTYWLSVVPQQTDGSLSTPAAVKTRAQCVLLWCWTSSVK